MGSEIIFLVKEAMEGGYQARALGHSIFTEGETWEEIRQAVKDAWLAISMSRTCLV